MILAPGAGEQAIVADAVEPAGQGVEPEAADELVSREGNYLMAAGAALAINRVMDSDATLRDTEEAAIRYGDPVGVARPVGAQGPGPGARRIGRNDYEVHTERDTGRTKG